MICLNQKFKGGHFADDELRKASCKGESVYRPDIIPELSDQECFAEELML